MDQQHQNSIMTSTTAVVTMRFLRGGNKGGGGYSSGGRGNSWGSGYSPGYHYGCSYNCGGGYRGDSSSSSGGELAAVIIVIIIVVFIIICIFASQHVSKSTSDENFQKVVEQEKERAKLAANSNSSSMEETRGLSSTTYETPKGGMYLFSYEEGYVIRSGKASLTFEDNHVDGYTIFGMITDDDGSSTIQEGFVGYDGQGAYWIDECTYSATGNVIRKPLAP